MNPEIHTIIETMKKRSPKNPIANSDIQTYLSIETSRLLVLLAEETETQNNKISEQTEKLIRFTKTIKVLTYALLFVGLVQIVAMILKC